MISGVSNYIIRIIILISISFTLFTYCKSQLNNTDPGPGRTTADQINKIVKKALISEARGCIYGNCVVGTGIFVYEEGDVYAGQFRNARRYGRGELHYKNGNSFKGMYVDDLREGAGVYNFHNGDRFSGNYLKGKPDGEGEYHFSDGRIYKGIFSDEENSSEGMLSTKTESRKCSIRETLVVCEN